MLIVGLYFGRRVKKIIIVPNSFVINKKFLSIEFFEFLVFEVFGSLYKYPAKVDCSFACQMEMVPSNVTIRRN